MIVLKTPICQKIIRGERCLPCGFDYPITQNTFKSNLTLQVKTLDNEIKQVEHLDLIGNGSLLDKSQIPFSEVTELFHHLKKFTNLKSIMIEGRPEFANKEKLLQLKIILNKDLEYGTGLESTEESIRNNILKKDIKTEDYIDFLEKIKKINITPVTYLLFGIPILDKEKSCESTKKSIQDVQNYYKKTNQKGRINIYPIFISKGSQIEKMYIKGKYELFKLKDLINILKSIKEKQKPEQTSIFIGLDDEKLSDNRYVGFNEEKEKNEILYYNKYNKLHEIKKI